MSWTLHHGDCLDPVSGLASLPDKSVGHVITDPPYEAEAHTMQRRVKRNGGELVATEPLDFDPITSEQRADVAAHMARVSRGWIVVFCQVEAVTAWRDALAAGGAKYRRTLPWVKPDAMPSLHGRWPGQSFEAIVLASVRGAGPCPGGGAAIAYVLSKSEGVPGGKAPHPTTKPLPLMTRLVELVSLDGETICDPFAGSGTTGVACNQLGRNFVGWERDANYHAIASRRLNGDEAKPRPEQPSLFGGA